MTFQEFMTGKEVVFETLVQGQMAKAIVKRDFWLTYVEFSAKNGDGWKITNRPIMTELQIKNWFELMVDKQMSVV